MREREIREREREERLSPFVTQKRVSFVTQNVTLSFFLSPSLSLPVCVNVSVMEQYLKTESERKRERKWIERERERGNE